MSAVREGDPEAVKVYVNLLYQIKDWFDPSTNNPRGLVLEDYVDSH